MRRKRNNSNSSKGIWLFIIGIIVVVIVIGKFFIGDNSMNIYKDYVKSYEEAVLKYSNDQLGSTHQMTTYQYKDFTELLIGIGYLEEWKDTNVVLEADPIILEKKDGNTSFYNYYNLETFENRFEIKFTKADKTYTCTKNECK